MWVNSSLFVGDYYMLAPSSLPPSPLGLSRKRGGREGLPSLPRRRRGWGRTLFLLLLQHQEIFNYPSPFSWKGRLQQYLALCPRRGLMCAVAFFSIGGGEFANFAREMVCSFAYSFCFAFFGERHFCIQHRNFLSRCTFGNFFPKCQGKKGEVINLESWWISCHRS